MKYDYATVYKKNAEFLNQRPRYKAAVQLLNAVLPYFFLGAYLLLWLYVGVIKEFNPKELVKIFCVPFFALFFVSILRLGIDRARPYAEKGAGIAPFKEKKNASCSFPSRHLTCAGVIATTFLPYLPAVGALLFVCALALGYCRFAMGWHYLSDLVVGLVLGVAIGSTIFFW